MEIRQDAAEALKPAPQSFFVVALTTNRVGAAKATPTMVVHSDGCALPDEAKKLYSELRGEKELVWADGTHFGYYDSPAQIDNAVANVTRFFRIHTDAASA